MNSYTTKQLLMCEKEDLVKYIEHLRTSPCLWELHDDVWNGGVEDLKEEYKMLKQQIFGIDTDDLKIEGLFQTEQRLGAENQDLVKHIAELEDEEETLKALHSQAVKEMDEWKMKCVEVGVDKQNLKEQAQITCDCKDVEIEALKDEVQVWEREQEELTEQNEKLKKQLEEVSKMNARVWKQLKRWPKKPDFNLSDDEEEKVEVKGTITITSDTEPFEEMVVEFSETITKEQYEDEDWMDNIDDHLKLTEPYSIAGHDIQIDFK
jgi:chromosome segregation ATPase